MQLSDVQAARKRLEGQVKCTPCTRSRTLSAITGAELYLKFENLQFTASFKERGALNCLSLLTSEQQRKGVIAMSAGNHAQGVALAAQPFGHSATNCGVTNCSSPFQFWARAARQKGLWRRPPISRHCRRASPRA